MPAGTRSINLLFQQREELGLGDAFLAHRIALAEGEGVAGLLDGVEIDRHAPRRAGLVLAAVAFADRAAVVVLHGIALLELGVEGTGAVGELLLVLEQG